MLRILNNIRAWAAPRPERSDVALWAVELSLLLPAHPARLRYDRAQLLVRSGDFLAGAAELEEYAEVVGAVDRRRRTIRRPARAARAGSTDPGASGPMPATRRTGYSQPFSRAIRTASARLRTASFWMAVER